MSLAKEAFDIIIVGAGPAGCAAAHQLSGKGLRIALIEKFSFPRDKICGDALSPDVVKQLQILDPQLAENFKLETRSSPCFGLRLFAEGGHFLDLPFPQVSDSDAPSYVMRRVDFDHFLFKAIKDNKDIHIYENAPLKSLSFEKDGVQAEIANLILEAKVILAADGAQSRVRSQLGLASIDKAHHCAGLRQYYKGIKDLGPKGQLELHFYPEIAPGYFWIFPLSEDEANVGIGMISQALSTEKIKLKERLEHSLKHNPQIKERFVEAEALEKPQGFGLPLGSLKRTCSGDRYLLLGDAAGLIDPLSGEGIGNAIRSGRVAAEHLLKAFAENRWDAAFNKAYDEELYRRMGNEFKVSVVLRRLIFYFPLYNRFIRWGSSSRFIRNLLSSIIDNRNFQKSLFNPRFYWQLLRK